MHVKGILFFANLCAFSCNVCGPYFVTGMWNESES